MIKDGDGEMFDSVLTNRDKKNEESLEKSGKNRKRPTPWPITP